MRKWSLLSVLILAFGVAACSDDDNPDCVDVDGDGYGEGVDCLGTDCDDDDATVWEDMTVYADADEDGEYSGTSVTMCTDGTLPAGYSETAGTDCDDEDATAWQLLPGYVDFDGDTYGDATEMDVCSGDTLPAGYVENGDDCDDADADAYVIVAAYADLDGDGESGGDATSLVPVCTDDVPTLPAGWTETPGTDCDDLDPFAPLIPPACDLIGTCIDTEPILQLGQPDMMGVGACYGVDCNGRLAGSDPSTFLPMFPIMAGPNQVTCPVGDECGAGNPCLSGLCWMPNPDCNVGTLTCSEIPTCLTQCGVDNPDDQLAYALCLQETCIENADPIAQHLYNIAQQCAAENGCFADPAQTQACALDRCLAQFGACLADTP